MALTKNQERYVQMQSERELDEDARYDHMVVADGWEGNYIRAKFPDSGTILVKPMSNGSIATGRTFTIQASGNGSRPMATWLNS